MHDIKKKNCLKLHNILLCIMKTLKHVPFEATAEVRVGHLASFHHPLSVLTRCGAVVLLLAEGCSSWSDSRGPFCFFGLFF